MHTNTELLSKSLRRSAATSRWIPSQSFVPQGKWWSICLTRRDGDQVCVREVEGRDGKRECVILSRTERPKRLLTCVEAWYSTVCVFHIDMSAVCVCVRTQHVLHVRVFFYGGREGYQANKISLPSAVLWLSFGPSLCPVFLPAPSN